MNTDLYLLIGIAVISAVTVALRAIPFLVFSGRKSAPDYIMKLSGKLPYAVMAMLVAYCYRNISFASAASFVPDLLCGVLVVILHLWKRNTILSIVVGTVAYMLLVQFVF